MRFLRRSLIGVFLLSLTLGLLAWAGSTFYSALQERWSREQAVRPARERVFAVTTVTAEPRTVAPVLTSFGEIRSLRTLDLRATASGRIVLLADGFEEGASVDEGQLLVRMDPSDAQAALDVAATDLREAEAELRDAQRSVDLAKDELTAAEDQLRLREQALARQKNLQSRGVVTEAVVENAELAVSSARQALLSRRQAVASAEARQDQAQNAVARRQINLAEAQRALAETEIHAGFAGTLAEVSAVQGGVVANNERLAQIIDTRALEVVFRVSTPQYTRLLDDQGRLIPARVRVSIDIFGVNLATTGLITRESAVVAEGQTGRQLFARIEDARGFRPGDFVTVEVDEPELSSVVVLPAAALDSASTVLVLGEDDRLEALPVEVLRRQGDQVIVSAGAIAGREVVAQRSPSLGAGIRVRPSRPQAEDVSEATPETPAMVALSPERRDRLVAFVEGNQFMPSDVKERILGQLQQEKVPAQVVERLEARMGG